MNALTVLTSEIRQLDGLYSLNDLQKAAGGARKHQPANFMRVDTTVALMEEISSSDVGIIPAKTIRGRGKPQGTYVCKELVYAYAMWISPKFHLAVIRAFDALQRPAIQVGSFPFLSGDTQHLAGQRFLLSFSEDGRQYAAKAIPGDACVMTPREFSRALSTPNDLYVDSATLSDLIVNCARRLECRIRG